MFRSGAVSALVTAAMSFWAGCSESKPDDKSAPVKQFPLRGEVIQIIPTMERIVVSHDAIKGWSAASNMGYPVRDVKEIEKLSIGNQSRAVVFVPGPEYWLAEIEVVSTKGGGGAR